MKEKMTLWLRSLPAGHTVEHKRVSTWARHTRIQMLTLCQARSGARIREWDTALALKELSHWERCGLPPE